MIVCGLHLISRSDFEFSEADPIPEEIPSVCEDERSTVTDTQAVDHFSHEEMEDISDPVLELHLASPLQSLDHSCPTDILLPVLPQLPSPDEEVEGEMEIDFKSQKGTPSLSLCMHARLLCVVGSVRSSFRCNMRVKDLGWTYLSS